MLRAIQKRYPAEKTIPFESQTRHTISGLLTLFVYPPAFSSYSLKIRFRRNGGTPSGANNSLESLTFYMRFHDVLFYLQLFTIHSLFTCFSRA